MSYEGLDSQFRARLEAMVQASGGRLYIVSGYRSVEEQQALWDGALAKYGSEDKAREWVAPPGSSNHNHGVAVDLGYSDDDAQAWARSNASRYGLVFPMDWEPWHIEPAGVRDGTYHSDAGHFEGDGHDHGPGTADSYTTAPAGYTGATDATRRFDLGYQLAQLGGILAGQVPDTLAGSGPAPTTAAQPTNRITGGGDGAL